MAAGPGVLETPSYISAAVFAVFLLLSLLLDKAIHAIGHKMSKWKRKGLKTAFDHIIQEVMLLGFISLLLIVFEENITSICVPKRHPSNNWMVINLIDECHPCLKHTKGISQAYKDEHQCPFWVDSHAHDFNSSKDLNHVEKVHAEPLVHGDEHTNEGTGHKRRLMAGGGSGDGYCGKGREALVTSSVLHQVHLFIFVLGVTHVLTSAIMIILSSLKIVHCRDCIQDNDKHIQRVTEHVQNGPQLLSSTKKIFKRIFSSRSVRFGDGDSARPDDQWSLSTWTSSDRDMTLLQNIVIEYIISFFKQCICPISNEEFKLLRASFMLTHQRIKNFDFHDYINAGLDDDFTQVVSINLIRGLTVALFILLLPPVTWTSWQATSGLLVLLFFPVIVATKLVYIVRHVTRGGRVHKLDASVYWFGRPKLLLPVINFILFSTSLIFSTLLYFAWQFGEVSCLFNGGGSTNHAGAHWSWIVILLINTATFLHLSIVTLPTYSLVVHMGENHWHKDLLPEHVQDVMIQLAKKVKKKSKASPATSSDQDAQENGSELTVITEA